MKTLFILPNRRKPFTASQYLAENEARANRIACARIDFRHACFRVICLTVALIALVTTGVGCLVSFLAL